METREVWCVLQPWFFDGRPWLLNRLARQLLGSQRASHRPGNRATSSVDGDHGNVRVGGGLANRRIRCLSHSTSRSSAVGAAALIDILRDVLNAVFVAHSTDRNSRTSRPLSTPIFTHEAVGA